MEGVIIRARRRWVEAKLNPPITPPPNTVFQVYRTVEGKKVTIGLGLVMKVRGVTIRIEPVVGSDLKSARPGDIVQSI